MTYTDAEIKRIIENHKHYLLQDCEEWMHLCANLSGANLSYADLHGVDLSYADLSGAYLANANLSGAALDGACLNRANLSNANLSNADLHGVDLSDANLIAANLSFAYLSGVNLIGADLSCANLIAADLSFVCLSEVNLKGADLSCAYLKGADLSDAKLSGVNLIEADLSDAKNIPFIPMACPNQGAFIGWKKANAGGTEKSVIVKLEIPEDALRSSSTGRKCRCNKAKVLAIENLDGSPAAVTSATSSFINGFVYHTGETVTVKGFDTNRWHECAPGIHFFMSRQEAVEY